MGDAKTSRRPPRVPALSRSAKPAYHSVMHSVVDNPAAGSPRYIDRELSWLEFNARVLALAENASLPLLERAKFLAIFSSNLDEFFQVRVSGLKEQQRAGIGTVSPDGMTVDEQLRAIRARVLELAERQAEAFGVIAERLGEVGLRYSNYEALDDDDRAHLDRVFEERVFPVLTP